MENEFPKKIQNELFEVTVYNSEIAEINKYLGKKQEVVIPSEIDGYPIKQISMMAFGNCTFLKKVDISEGINYIGTSVFRNCVNLEYVSLPKSLETIFFGAFSGCNSLRILEIPDNVSEIRPNAFYYLNDIEIHVTLGSAADKQMNKKNMGFIRKKESYFDKENKTVWVRDPEFFKKYQ